MSTASSAAPALPVVTVAEASPRGRRLIYAVVTGVLLAASFPSMDFEPLAWVALVPLLLALRGLRPGAAFFVGWVGGFTFFTLSVYWIAYTVAHFTTLPWPVAVFVLLLTTSALGCYVGAFAAGFTWFGRRLLPALWLAAPLWVALEWLRGWFFIGFPWAPLGASQYRYHDFVQLAEVTGVWGPSAVLVFFNVVVAGVFERRGRGLVRMAPALVVLTILMVGIPAWGRWRVATLHARPPAGSLRVAVAQGNVEQDVKWDKAFVDETMARYARLTEEVAASKPGLVVWPETAMPFFFQEPGEHRQQVLDIARTNHVALVVGSPAAIAIAPREYRQTNRAYLVTAEGRDVGSYDKRQLVPFGEYVPFQSVLFFVGRIVEAVGDIVPGVSPTVFTLGEQRFGTLICYEGIFPGPTREFAYAGANFLVNISNDGWYGRSSAPYQLLAQVTLRAIENRVPIVRAANTGISAIVDDDGRVQWEGPLFEQLAHADEIQWTGVRTLYTRFGDWLPRSCLLLIVVAGIIGARRRVGAE